MKRTRAQKTTPVITNVMNRVVSIVPQLDASGVNLTAMGTMNNQKNGNTESHNETSDRKANTTETIKGKSGGKARIELMKDVANTLVNIERKMIGELSTEFMNVW